MLEVKNLSKRFNRLPVVDGVSFVLRPHEVTGYLGPNGAGKTTTVRMLTALLEPSEGDIFFDGGNIREQRVDFRRRLGYVPEEPAVYSYLTGWEYLQMVGRLRLIPERKLDQRISEFLRLFSLYHQRHSPLSAYSKGMRQKILISAALLHNPDLLIFDEPLSGLDLTSALIFRHLVEFLAREGKTILYSSHILESVEKQCTRVIILHKGRLVANDSVRRLRDMMKLPSLEEVFSELVVEEDTEQVAHELVEVMKGC